MIFFLRFLASEFLDLEEIISLIDLFALVVRRSLILSFFTISVNIKAFVTMPSHFDSTQ